MTTTHLTTICLIYSQRETRIQIQPTETPEEPKIPG